MGQLGGLAQQEVLLTLAKVIYLYRYQLALPIMAKVFSPPNTAALDPFPSWT